MPSQICYCTLQVLKWNKGLFSIFSLNATPILTYTRKFIFKISQHHQIGAKGDVQRVCGGDISGDVCDVFCFCLQKR